MNDLATEYGLVPEPELEPAEPVPPEKLTEFEWANLLAQKLPPIKTCGSEWFAYAGGAWAATDRAAFRPAAQNILVEKIRTDRRAGLLLDHLEGRFQVPRDSWRGFYRYDGEAVLLNVGNGILRVTGDSIELRPHDPAEHFRLKIPTHYVPEAACPLFQRVLGEVLPDPADQDLFQLCAGNFLLPDAKFETCLVCYGEAGRGKSTLAEPIAGTLGPDLVPRLTLSQLCDPRSYHLPKLRFAAVNLGTELDAVQLDDSGAFKAIVSGEAVEARPIYGAPFTMQTTAKLWFLANQLPRFKHGTGAELRRTRFLRFDYVPPKKDPTLKARLIQEREGVLRWMLAGLAQLLQLNEIALGGAESRKVHERFRVGNDPVGAFIAARCTFDPEGRVSKTTLAEAYKEFCEEHELPTTCNEWFFRALFDRWPNLLEVRVRRGEQRERAVCGLTLKAHE